MDRSTSVRIAPPKRVSPCVPKNSTCAKPSLRARPFSCAPKGVFPDRPSVLDALPCERGLEDTLGQWGRKP
jgi:hypothetical protein